MTAIFSFLPEKTRSITSFELGGFSTSYVIATSELADSQVSFASSLVASQPVMSLRPLNWQIAKSQPRYLLTSVSYTHLTLPTIYSV